jgi:hypothetical protein
MYIRQNRVVDSSEPSVSSMNLRLVSADYISLWLSMFGFDFELEKRPALTIQERQFCVAYGTGYLVRCRNGELRWYAELPVKRRRGWSLEFEHTTLIKDMFSFITPDTYPMSVAEMFMWEVK